MDPDAAWTAAVRLAGAIVDNPSGDVEAVEMAEYVLALDEWLAKGGFPPAVFVPHDPEATTDVIDAQGVRFEPWTDRWAIGFRCVHPDGRAEFVYLNPSSDSDDDVSNIFLYHDDSGDPGSGQTVVFVDLFTAPAPHPQAGRLRVHPCTHLADDHDLAREFPDGAYDVDLVDYYGGALTLGEFASPTEAHDYAGRIDPLIGWPEYLQPFRHTTTERRG